MNSQWIQKLLKALKSLSFLSGVFMQQTRGKTQKLAHELADLTRQEKDLLMRPPFGEVLQDVLRDHAKLLRDEQNPDLAMLISNIEALASDELISHMRRDMNLRQHLQDAVNETSPFLKERHELQETLDACYLLAEIKAGSTMGRRMEDIYGKFGKD